MCQGGLQPPRALCVLDHGEAADEDEEPAAQQLGHAGLDVALVPVRLRGLGLDVDVHRLLHWAATTLGSGHERGWNEAGRALAGAGHDRGDGAERRAGEAGGAGSGLGGVLVQGRGPSRSTPLKGWQAPLDLYEEVVDGRL